MSTIKIKGSLFFKNNWVGEKLLFYTIYNFIIQLLFEEKY